MDTLILDRPIRQQRVAFKEETCGDSREEIIVKLKEAAKDLKLIKEGKLEGRPLKDFLNDL